MNGPLLPNGPMGGDEMAAAAEWIIGPFQVAGGEEFARFTQKKKSTPVIAGPIENLVKDACIILGLKAECVRAASDEPFFDIIINNYSITISMEKYADFVSYNKIHLNMSHKA